MHVAAFLTLYNELANGNLLRCLESCRLWADTIWIYDDGSTDGSQEVYPRFTDPGRCILSPQNDWSQELAHKAELLDLIHESDAQPDWLVWIDGDTTWERAAAQGDLRAFLEKSLPRKLRQCGIARHVNLWGSESVERIDNGWASLRPRCVWRYRPRLRFGAGQGLHQDLWPVNVGATFEVPFRLVHYGYASPEAIQRKIEAYRRQGQSGWDQERLENPDLVVTRPVDPGLI